MTPNLKFAFYVTRTTLLHSCSNLASKSMHLAFFRFFYSFFFNALYTWNTLSNSLLKLSISFLTLTLCFSHKAPSISINTDQFFCCCNSRLLIFEEWVSSQFTRHIQRTTVQDQENGIFLWQFNSAKIKSIKY